jgi:hypothetical protein
MPPGAPSELYPAVLNCRDASVARVSKGSRGRGAPRAPPADQRAQRPFPRIPQGDIILRCPDLRTLSADQNAGAC